jgi:serine/threonine-protein kinase
VPVPLILGALAALVVAAVVIGLLQQGTPSGATATDDAPSSRSASAPPEPETVDVVAADLVGRPVDEVQAELVAQGLQVTVVPVETGDVPANQVTAATPEGQLTPGTAVTVSYAVAPAPAPVVTDQGHDPGQNPGNGKGKDKGKKKDD